MDATAKQGLGAATATIGSACILGWILLTGITGQNRQFLPATGLGLITAGGTLLTAGRIQERNELLELQIEIARGMQK